MKKMISTLVVAGAALLSSCGKEEMTNVMEPGLQPVTLSVSLGKMQTRANAGGDEEVTRCLVQVLDDTGTPVEGYGTAQEMTGNQAGGYSKTVILDGEKTYTLLFWADRGEECYNAAQLNNVSKADGADATKAIAYAAKVEWSAGSGREITATLKHVVTKLTVRTTADVEGGTLRIDVPQTYPAYSVQTGKTDGEVTTLSYTETVADVAADNDVCSVYALVGDEPQSVTLNRNDYEDEEVPNVPLAPNKHVILKGNVDEIGGRLTVTMSATIDPEWGGESEIELHPKAKVGDYFYADGTWRTAYINIPSNPCIGIVFAVNADGKSGKIVSLDETEKAWRTSEGGVTNAFDKDDGEKNMKSVRSFSWAFESFPAFRWCHEREEGGLNWYLPAPHELQDLYAASCGLILVSSNPQKGEAVRWDVIKSSALFEEDRQYTDQRNNFKSIIEKAGGKALGDYLSSYELPSPDNKYARKINCSVDGGGAGVGVFKTDPDAKVRAIARFPKQ